MANPVPHASFQNTELVYRCWHQPSEILLRRRFSPAPKNKVSQAHRNKSIPQGTHCRTPNGPSFLGFLLRPQSNWQSYTDNFRPINEASKFMDCPVSTLQEQICTSKVKHILHNESKVSLSGMHRITAASSRLRCPVWKRVDRQELKGFVHSLPLGFPSKPNVRK